MRTDGVFGAFPLPEFLLKFGHGLRFIESQRHAWEPPGGDPNFSRSARKKCYHVSEPGQLLHHFPRTRFAELAHKHHAEPHAQGGVKVAQTLSLNPGAEQLPLPLPGLGQPWN